MIDYFNSERLKADTLLRNGRKFAFRATINDVYRNEKSEPRFAKNENYIIPPDETVIFGDQFCLSAGCAYLLVALGLKRPIHISTPADFVAASQLVRRNLAQVVSQDCKIICEITDAGRAVYKMQSLDGPSWKQSKIDEYRDILQLHETHSPKESTRYAVLSRMELPILLELLPTQRRRIVVSARGDFKKAGYEAARIINKQIVFAWNTQIIVPLARSRNDLFMEIRSQVGEIDNVSKIESQEKAVDGLLRLLDIDISVAQHLNIAQRFLAETRTFLEAVDQIAAAPRPVAKLYVLS